MRKYIFDVDGTLTPSRSRIDESFEPWFLDFCTRNEVYIVTGSDYKKTQEQLGDGILHQAVRVYACSGNDMWIDGRRRSTSVWQAKEDLLSTLELFLSISKFIIRTGKHIEHRPGTLNFSVVGRNASKSDRKAYVEWDEKTKEREKFAKKLNTLFSKTFHVRDWQHTFDLLKEIGD